MAVGGVGDVDVPMAQPLGHVGDRHSMGEQGRHERMPQAVRREPCRDTGLARMGVELVAVGNCNAAAVHRS